MWKFGRVLVAGEALFLVVDDEARPVRLREFNERDTGVVRARTGEAADIDRRRAIVAIVARPISLSMAWKPARAIAHALIARVT